MTLSYPQLAVRPAAENRSRGALIGIAIGVVTCVAAMAVAIAYTLRIHHLQTIQSGFDRFPYPRDNSGPVAFIGIAVVVTVFGVVACILARQFNGWRITAAVLGFIAAAAYAFTALGCLGAADEARFDTPFPDDFGGWDGHGSFNSAAEALNNAQLRQAYQQAAILAGILALLALVAAILIVTGNSNGWYTRNEVRVVSYGFVPGALLSEPGQPTGAVFKPAGWYPVEDGRLRWWNGHDWTEHFHDGR